LVALEQLLGTGGEVVIRPNSFDLGDRGVDDEPVDAVTPDARRPPRRRRGFLAIGPLSASS